MQFTIAWMIVIWFVGLFFLLIRKGIEIHWKLAALLIFAFYVWYEWKIIISAWQVLQNDYKIVILQQIQYLGKIIFVLWPVYWAIVLIIVFYMVDEGGIERLIKISALLTIIFWIIWIIDHYWGDQFGPWIMREIPKFLP